MNNVFFKLVIPVYNTIAYLPHCINSILNQTYKNFNILLIDDCSQDYSTELCKMYERKYPNIIRFIKLDNHLAPGNVRNIGINYTYIKSEYTWFIDSDDYLYSNDVLQKAFDTLQSLQYDILFFGWCRLINEKIIYNPSSNNKTLFENFKTRLANCYWNGAPLKIIKSSIIPQFLNNFYRSEDTYQFLLLMEKNPLYIQLFDVFYVYRNNLNSVTHQKIYLDQRFQLYDEYKLLYTKTNNNNIKESILFNIKNSKK